MTEELSEAVKKAVKQAFDVEIEPQITRPEERFGDYSTNVALQLAAQLHKNPKEIADALVSQLDSLSFVEKVDETGGFLNIWVTDEVLAETALSAKDLPISNKGKEILVEF